jgi:hypothetical protein
MSGYPSIALERMFEIVNQISHQIKLGKIHREREREREMLLEQTLSSAPVREDVL